MSYLLFTPHSPGVTNHFLTLLCQSQALVFHEVPEEIRRRHGYVSFGKASFRAMRQLESQTFSREPLRPAGQPCRYAGVLDAFADREIGFQIHDGRAIECVDAANVDATGNFVDALEGARCQCNRVGAVLGPAREDAGEVAPGIGRLGLQPGPAAFIIVFVGPPEHQHMTELVQLLQGRPEWFKDLQVRVRTGPPDETDGVQLKSVLHLRT